ncbi:MAG TPA: hypothetical protein VLW50_31525 [Streptosporangiaceae bacterium]|nr:hypothetical protein [Streptosporangiaceae bacterium]
MAQGQLTVEELVGRYRLQCKPVRDLLVDYLWEGQPVLDYASLDSISSSLAGLFWARIEALSSGIATLRLPPEVARAWKEDLLTIKRSVTGPDGQKTVATRPRINAKDELIRVRALYLDIAQRATEEPGRWAQWAVPSPVSDAEINWARERRRRKARMDQRTRERLPVLPVLTRTAAGRKNATARRLQAAMSAPPGEIIEGTGGILRRAVAPKANGRHVWAEDAATGKRRNLCYEEEEAFRAFAVIEVLRLTGIRCEERSRASSARSSSLSAPSPSPRWRLSALTRLPRVPSLMPRSRATCAIGLAVSRTSRTAPSRKSASNFLRVSAIAVLLKAMSPRYEGKPTSAPVPGPTQSPGIPGWRRPPSQARPTRLPI